MGNMEKETLDLINFDQEDDSLLLAASPADAEGKLGVSPLSPSILSCKKKPAPSEDLENCSEKEHALGGIVEADVDAKLAPVPCKSPAVPSSVLSVLNVNKMNKRKVYRDAVEETWSRKGCGTRDSMQLDGIAETSPVKNPGTFTSQLSRSYLDIENEQAGVKGATPERGGVEPTPMRRSRSRRSTTLRKSLAWDKAFFTDEGVLDNDELFAVASDSPKTLQMPELATIWDGPQNLITPFETKTSPSPVKGLMQTQVTTAADVKNGQRRGPKLADAKPHEDVLPSASLRTVRQLHTSGSHAFSNAYARAAAIPQGSPSIPMPNGLPRTGKQHTGVSRHPVEPAHSTNSDSREPRTTSAGLHHQARIAALKKAHEGPAQKGPRIRLPTSNSSKKVEEKPPEEVHRVMTRSMSTPSLYDSPSALSRKVSSMSKKVKDTLGKVMTGRAYREAKDPLSSHVLSSERTSTMSKRFGALPTVPEFKGSSTRTRTPAASNSVNVNKEVYTVRDMLRGKVPPSSSQESPRKGLVLTRSKSAISGPPRAADIRLTRNFAPSAPPAPVQPPEPDEKPTGLRKPSPKLGFFDAARASSAPQNASASSQLFQGSAPARPGNEASNLSNPNGSLAQRLQGFSFRKGSSAIPSAPHLRHDVTSAPTSPRTTRVMYPSSPKGQSSRSTRSSSAKADSVALPVNHSGIRHAEQFAESHQLLANRMLLGDVNGKSSTAPELSALDSFKLPETSVTFTDKSDERKKELVQPDDIVQDGSARMLFECNQTVVSGAADTHAQSGSRLASRGGKHGSLITNGSITARNSTDTILVKKEVEIANSSEYAVGVAARQLNSGQTSACKAVSGASQTWDFPEAIGHLQSENYSALEECDRSGSPCTWNPNDIPTTDADSCDQCEKATRGDGPPPTLCPGTPTIKENSHIGGTKPAWQYDSPRSRSFRDTSTRVNTPNGSPVGTSQHTRSLSQRPPWQMSPAGSRVGGDASPSFCPSTPASAKRSKLVSPSHAPDAGGTFETLTPTSAKNARCVRTPGSSAKKAIRKIVEFESPSSNWSDWPVLGAAIPVDQVPGSGKKDEVLTSVPPRPPEEQATEQSIESQPDLPRVLSAPLVKSGPADVNCAEDGKCSAATETSSESRLNNSGSTPGTVRLVDSDSGTDDRSLLPECGSAKKEKGSSLFSIAKKAVIRLTTSPSPSDPPGQENEGSRSRRTSRRFSRSSSNTTCLAAEPKVLSPFSEERICALEAAGQEALQSKSGPVQNSPPDKIVPEPNPWSPVKTNRQPLGPFDCTKLKYTANSGLTT